MVSIMKKLFGLIVCYFILMALTCVSGNAAAISANVPPNVFADDVVNTSIVWWRPYRVIFDPNKTAVLQHKLDAISDQQANTIILDFAEGDGMSAFVFPILAVNQTKGTTLLNRYLQEYKTGKSLDNRWLLIIASLGRSPTVEAGVIIEQELDRIVNTCDPYINIKNTDGKTIQRRKIKDERIPVIDALLANLAVRKSLNAHLIETIDRRFPQKDLKCLCWYDGMNWVLRYDGKDAVCKIIVEGLSTCSDQELYDATNMKSPTDRIMLIRNFMFDSNDVWPLTKEILITQHDQVRESVLDFLLVCYSGIMTLYAEENRGVYVLDDAIFDLYKQKEFKNRMSFAYEAELLKACQPSKPNPEWQVYLDKHAAQLDTEWRIATVNHIKRILGESGVPRPSHERLDPEKVYGRFKDPGIYMVGF